MIASVATQAPHNGNHSQRKILLPAYLGNRDSKSFVLQKWCSAQNSAISVRFSIARMETRVAA